MLRKIYVERNPYPFLEWGGYENVVWNHQIGLPIEFEIETVERTNLTDFTICISLGLGFDRDGNDKERKPDRILEKEKGYKKSELPNYAFQLNFKRLLKESNSFRKFYKELQLE